MNHRYVCELILMKTFTFNFEMVIYGTQLCFFKTTRSRLLPQFGYQIIKVQCNAMQCDLLLPVTHLFL